MLAVNFSRRALQASAMVLALCALGACKQEQPAAPDPSAPATADRPQAQAAPPQEAVSAQVAAMGVEDLRAAASKALTEQRLYAPAGDNAMEYYVALRDKAPEDPSVASALTDLMPYALIATEQSIARDDLAEAQRLYALMAKVDAKAPALPRLKQSIADAQASLVQRTAAAEAASEADAERQQALERERTAEQQRAQQQAAAQLATEQQQQAAAQRAAEQQAAEQRAAEQRAAEQRAAEQRAAQQAPPQPAPTEPAAPAALRALSTPAPAYPPEALRAGESGEVVVEFTVNPDGSVSNARVVRANPPRTFDRAALSAVRRWRFQPVASATTTRRTIGFSPGQ